MQLTQEQINHFERDGYLIVDSVYDDKTIDMVVNITSRMYGVNGVDVKQHGSRLQDVWRSSPSVRKIASNKNILDILRQLYNAEPFAFQTLNFPIGTQQKAHSDTIHFNSDPSGYMAGVWVALEDVDETNGPLLYYPGSHKLPEVTMQTIGIPHSTEYYPQYEQYIQQVVKDNHLTERVAIMKKGQALIWAANLLHGGAEQTDKTRSRHSQVTHYYFEGTQYYTPMLSGDGYIEYRNPHRI